MMSGTIRKRRVGEITLVLACKHETHISFRSYRLGFYGKTQRCQFDGLQVVEKARQYEWHWRCQSCPRQYWSPDQADALKRRDAHKAVHPSHYLSGCLFDRVTEDGRGTMLLGEKVPNRLRRRSRDA